MYIFRYEFKKINDNLLLQNYGVINIFLFYGQLKQIFQMHGRKLIITH